MNIEKETLFVIVNPISGGKKKTKPLQRLSFLREEGYIVLFHWTEYPHHATELARQAVSENTDYVVVVGGDGTINEVAQALVHTNIPLAIIPHGSGNGLARHLGISFNLSKAIDVIRYGKIFNIDYGKANGHFFFCTCGIGYDAQVSLKSLDAKNRGKIMYLKNMLSVFKSYRPEKYKVTSKDGTYEGKAFAITCANANQYGNNGFIAPKADISDGLMNIEIISPISAIHIPKLGFQMLTKRINKNKKLKEIITQKAILERESDGAMHLDGNAVMMNKNIEIEIIHQGLNVLIP